MKAARGSSPPFWSERRTAESSPFDQAGHLSWSHQLVDPNGPVSQIMLLDNPVERQERILAVSGNTIYTLRETGSGIIALPFASFSDSIQSVYTIEQPGGSELSLSLVVFTETGAIHGLNWRGIEMSQWPWPYQLAEPATKTISSSSGSVEAFQENATAFLVATRTGRLVQIGVDDNQPVVTWDKGGLERHHGTLLG